jgi:hypothetical protein
VFTSRRKATTGEKLRNFIWPRSGVGRAWRYLMHRMARMQVSSHKLAIGFAAGAFVSFTPFIGLHFVLAAIVALLIRGNIIASAVGTVVGNPITFPFIWIASYNVGAHLLERETLHEISIAPGGGASLLTEGPIAFVEAVWHSVEPVILPMTLGGIPLGILCAAGCYAVVRFTIERLKLKRRRARAF